MRRYLVVLSFFLITTYPVTGQTIYSPDLGPGSYNTLNDEDNGDAPPPPPEGAEVPLDGGLLYLLAGGVLIGIKKFKDLKSK
ncbi:MAG: PID-CTERM protein-sorting domain-containing protein [Cyclobacteriaceae bacterium]